MHEQISQPAVHERITMKTTVCSHILPRGRAQRKGLRANRAKSGPWGDNNNNSLEGVVQRMRWGGTGVGGGYNHHDYNGIEFPQGPYMWGDACWNIGQAYGCAVMMKDVAAEQHDAHPSS